jgi:hypothetical protein
MHMVKNLVSRPDGSVLHKIRQLHRHQKTSRQGEYIVYKECSRNTPNSKNLLGVCFRIINVDRNSSYTNSVCSAIRGSAVDDSFVQVRIAQLVVVLSYENLRDLASEY